MEGSDTNTPMKVSSDPQVGVVSPTNSSSCSQVQVVMSPCAACKILRRRCAEKCVLAPYFPPTEPAKFTTAHRVFGASNIIKFLQELPESQRADAVTSMVYEAGARIRDPVYGSAGAICQLQKQVNELQAQLAKAQAELVNMQLQQANLVALICMQMADPNNNNNIHHPTIMQHQREDHEPSSPQQSVDNFIISSPPHAPAGYHHHHQNHNNNNNLNFFFEENTTTSLMNSMWEPLWT